MLNIRKYECEYGSNRKVSYMVVLNESGGKVDRSNLVTRRDVKKTSRSVAEETKEKSFGDFGSRMLEQMGWRTGQSLGLDGDSGAHIVDPVTVSHN